MCEVNKTKLQLGILSFFAPPPIKPEENDKLLESEFANQKKQSKTKSLQNNSSKLSISKDLFLNKTKKLKNEQSGSIDKPVSEENEFSDYCNVLSSELEVSNVSLPLVENVEITDDNACNSYERTDSIKQSSDKTSDSQSSEKSSSSNVFSFMMNNRHRQNEIIKKMAEEEKLRNEQESSIIIEHNISPSKELVSTSATLREEIVGPLNFSPQSAFALLVPSKKVNSTNKEEQKDPDYNPFAEVLAKRSKNYKKSHKRLTKMLDSSLEDFEEIFSASTTNKRKALNSKGKSFSIFESDGSAEEEALSSPLNKSNTSNSSKSDKKLDLVNDEELPCLEDTFRNEIQECVNSTKKRVKKKKLSKLEDEMTPQNNSTTKISAKESSHNLAANEIKGSSIFNSGTDKIDSLHSSQTGIMNYFKQVSKRNESGSQSMIVEVEVHNSRTPKKASTKKVLSKADTNSLPKIKQPMDNYDEIFLEGSIENPVTMATLLQNKDSSSDNSVAVCPQHNGIKINNIVQNILNGETCKQSEQKSELNINDLIINIDKENAGHKKVFSIFNSQDKKKSLTRMLRDVRIVKNNSQTTSKKEKCVLTSSSTVDELEIINHSPPVKHSQCTIDDSLRSENISITNIETNSSPLNKSNVFNLMMKSQTKADEVIKIIDEVEKIEVKTLSGAKPNNSKIHSSNDSQDVFTKLIPLTNDDISLNRDEADPKSKYKKKVRLKKLFKSSENVEKILKVGKLKRRKETNVKPAPTSDLEEFSLSCPKPSLLEINTEVTSSEKDDSSFVSERKNSKLQISAICDVNPDGEDDSSNNTECPLRRSSRKVKKIEPFYSGPFNTSKDEEKRIKKPAKGVKSFESADDSEKENKLSLKSSKRKNAKKIRGNNGPGTKKASHRIMEDENSTDSEGEMDEDIIILESPVKSEKNDAAEKQLAPIFMRKGSQSEHSLSPSKMKARLDFLFSDAPEEVKVVSPIEIVEECDLWPCIPSISHITQRNMDETYFDLPVPTIQSLCKEDPGLPNLEVLTDSLSKLIDKSSVKTPPAVESPPTLSVPTLCHVLDHLKDKNPSFPVNSIFKSYLDSKEEAVALYKSELDSKTINQSRADDLNRTDSKRKRRNRLSTNKRRKLSKSAESSALYNSEEDNSLLLDAPLWHQWVPFGWNQIFAPKSSRSVIGNSVLVSQLKLWLQDWKNNIELQTVNDRAASSLKKGEDSSSYEPEDSLVNTLLLCGPSGVGKTSTIYALAQELGFQVLEVNASARRHGKQVMSQLSEATQSHIVSSANAFSMGNPPNPTVTADEPAKKKVRKQQSCILTQGNCLPQNKEFIQETDKKKNMALILFKDIDIVFEESDDGFLSTVNYFISTTKRPIVLTTSNPTPCTTSRIKGNFSEITFARPSPKEVAQYLQLMCLAGSGIFSSAKEVEALVASNKGDIRKTILDLQFWALSGSCKVQWFKMDSKKSSKTRLQKDDSSSDISLQNIFPDYKLRKSVDVPISLGCSWSRTDLEEFKENDKIGKNWSLVSGNIASLLPFSLKLKEKLPPKYPIKDDDPDIYTSGMYQRQFWLSVDSDEEKEEVKVDAEKYQERKEHPAQIMLAASDCIDNLASFLDSLATLDTLSSYHAMNDDSNDFEHWSKSLMTSDLEWSTDKHDPTPHYMSLSLGADLASSISTISYRVVHKNIQNCFKSLDCRQEWPPLTIPVEGIPPTIFLHPHQFTSLCHHHHLNLLNKSAVSYLPSHVKPQRTAIAKDVLPYVRAFARADQLGEAIQRLRRGRRFLSYLKQLGIYLSQDQLISLSNLFNVV